MLIVSVCSDNKPFSPAGRQIDKSTIFLGKRVDILREGIPRQYRSDDDEQQRPARQEYVSKETLQKPLVIGGIGLQNARGCQNDGSQYSWRLPGCSAEEVAPLGCSPIQIPVKIKIPSPTRAAPAIDLARPKNVCCITISSSRRRLCCLDLRVERGIARSTRFTHFFEVFLQRSIGFFDARIPRT
jgi:hypothetical protein